MTRLVAGVWGFGVRRLFGLFGFGLNYVAAVGWIGFVWFSSFGLCAEGESCDFLFVLIGCKQRGLVGSVCSQSSCTVQPSGGLLQGSSTALFQTVKSDRWKTQNQQPQRWAKEPKAFNITTWLSHKDLHLAFWVKTSSRALLEMNVFHPKF